MIFISLFLFYCFLCNHSFPTNPNKITNCFKLILFYYNFTTTLLLRRFLISDSDSNSDSDSDSDSDAAMQGSDNEDDEEEDIDTSYIAVACEDGTIRTFDVSDTYLTYNRSTPRGDGRQLSICLHEDGDTMYAGSSDGLIRCYSRASSAVLFRVTVENYGKGKYFKSERERKRASIAYMESTVD